MLADGVKRLSAAESLLEQVHQLKADTKSIQRTAIKRDQLNIALGAISRQTALLELSAKMVIAASKHGAENGKPCTFPECAYLQQSIAELGLMVLEATQDYPDVRDIIAERLSETGVDL